jgi:DNA-binding response OmpR family regulator
MRVLLVDDEKELVSTLAERMGIRGIDADWVTSGEAALELVESRSYDLAVLDIKIPRISGVSLKKRLQEKNPHMKFIFMTGHGSEDDFKAGSREAGPEFYLVKPIDIQILIQKMTTALEDLGDAI